MEKFEIKNTGMWLTPAAIQHVRDNKINIRECFILSQIMNFTKNGGICHASNLYFARSIGKSVDMAKRHISKLKKAKLIIATNENNGVRLLSAAPQRRKKDGKTSGIWIPKQVIFLIQCGEISLQCGVILSKIISFQKVGKECFIGDESIGQDIGICKRAVRKHIRKLKDLKYIKATTTPHKRITTVRCAVVSGGCRKFLGGGAESSPYLKGYMKDKKNILKKVFKVSNSFNGTPVNSTNTPHVNEKDPDMFFEELETPDSITEFDIKCVETLHKAVIEKRGIRKRISKKQWANDFRKLRTHQNEKTITIVLNWYCENLGGEFIPIAYCGKTFRDKFERIEDAYHRSPESLKTNVPHDPDTETVCNTIKRELGGPTVFGDATPDLVNQCLVGYKQFQKAFRALENVEGVSSSVLAHVQRQILPPRVFVYAWIMEAHDKCRASDTSWKNYIPQLSWNLKNTNLERMCTRITKEYTLSPKSGEWWENMRNKTYENL